MPKRFVVHSMVDATRQERWTAFWRRRHFQWRSTVKNTKRGVIGTRDFVLTVGGLSAIVIGAFYAGFIAGYITLGVCLLILDWGLRRK